MIRLLVMASVISLLISPQQAAAQALGLAAPDGFEISLYADDDLAHDIYSMTIDSRGRIVVAGRDYIKILHDDDQDGTADRATLFSDVPKSGAHGMVFLGSDLLCTGDNSLMLLRDQNQDDKADGPPEIVTNVRHSEHGANGLTVGPDGWVYLICGNDANVFSKHVGTPHSPILAPKFGTLLRFNPKTWESEVVAHGFRNPYDVAFNADGRAFTVDADGERDQYLPWFTPNRLFDISTGHHHGWILHGHKRSWNRPESFFDSGPRLVEVGRGSPTGVEVYRHHQFPKKYHNGVFSCCWTLGEVYFFPMQREGAGYQSQKTTFLRTTGDAGLAPVDIAVGPSGDMFLAIGGRGTRGAIYRIHYVGKEKTEKSIADMSKLNAVLQAPQPTAAWSRANWLPMAKEIGSEAFDKATIDSTLPLASRLRAIEILAELFGGASEKRVDLLLNQDQANLVSRTIWSLGVKREEMLDARVVLATDHESPWVQRTAWETITSAATYDDSIEKAAWSLGLASSDRYVRAACLAALKRVAARDNSFELEIGNSIAAKWVLQSTENGSEIDSKSITQHALETLANSPSVFQQQDAVRVIQLALGDIPAAMTRPDVYAGYMAGDLEAIAEAERGSLAKNLAEVFPTNRPTVDREILRTLAMLEVEVPDLVEKILSNTSSTATLQSDVHRLICLSKIPGKRSEESTQQIASIYTSLHQKMEDNRYFTSRNWPDRVGEAYDQELMKNPALATAVIKSRQFGRLEHTLFLTFLEEELQRKGLRKIIKKNDPADLEESWPIESVTLVMTLSNKNALELLRARWEDYNLRELILVELAKLKQEEDRDRFVESLLSVKSQSVLLAADTLRRMPVEEVTEEHLLTAMKTLRSSCTLGQNSVIRSTVSRLLRYWSDEPINIREIPGDLPIKMYQPWFTWFAEKYPEKNRILESYAGGDASEWKDRIAALDLDAGDLNRGKKLFAAKGCQQCHADSGRLGPKLDDITGRFNRHDLFMAIVDPNKDVSPLFHSTQIMTSAGKSYIGLMIYESPDGTLIQTGPGKTLRIAGERIIEKRKSQRSIMPVGLLNGVDDQQLADLYRYLQSLKIEK
ncbi:MAG: hypothetical protein COA78_33925 [Blastopirellula sp.]|nr:MAG: hypothetical protein COA78_33925 [Blastopirellula sp.]